MNKCVNLILSAGYSTRMRGADKLLEKIDGVSQLCRITKAAAENGVTFMTLPSADHPRNRAVSAISVQRIFLNNRNKAYKIFMIKAPHKTTTQDTKLEFLVITPNS